VQSGSASITVVQGSTQNVATVITLINETGNGANVVNNVSVDPNNAGVSIAGDYPPSGYVASSSTTFVLNQSFQGNQVGTYVVTNTATIQGTSITASDTITIQVVPPPMNLTVQSGSAFITVAQGSAQNVVTLITLFNETGNPATVVNTVSVNPNNGGVGITDDYPQPGYVGSSSTAFVLNQSFLGLIPGVYAVSNHASIVGTSIEAQDLILVTVLPPGGDPIILNPSSTQRGPTITSRLRTD